MIPVSYGPTKQVEPIEKDYIIGYTDKQGNDYVGVAPDFNNEPWFSELITKCGLENLCREYPYQPLKVDKETAMLVPASNSFSNPIAKLTNCFHVIYHMRKDKLNEQNPLYNSLVDKPSIGIHGSNLITNLVNNSAESKVVTPNWSSAYHHEIEIPQIHDVLVNNFIENEEDDKNKHAIANVDVSVTLDTTNVPKGWHPNNEPIMQQPAQPFTVSNTQPNPYAYNPAYGMSGTYLPQYKTTTLDDSQYPFLTVSGDANYDMFEDAMRRRAETEQANLEYATRTNLFAKQNNPTLLDTSNTVDFSNPESVAKMQGMYANPYYNNMNNPNFMTQSQSSPYGMSNPYGGVVNPLYGQYNTNYGYYGGGWWNNTGVDLGFMTFSPEEIRLGKGFSVKLTRGKKETKTAPTVSPKKKKSNKITVQLVKVVEVVRDGKTIQIPKDQYKEESETEEERLTGSVPDRDQKAFKWYGEEYKKQVVKLAKELADYDEARALCLVGSLDDASVSKYDFKYYYQACEDKLHWYRVQEQANPEKDYRVPFRYRRTPIPKKGIDGKLTFESYTIPMKRFVTLPTNESVPFYEFDRGKEPDDDEWTAFYEQAEYIRDQEIQIMKAKAVEEYEKNSREAYAPVYYSNSIEARLQELRNEDRMRKNQYDVFRTAYGSSVSDAQFDAWWYRGNYAAMPNKPRTEEELVAQRKQWRHNMGIQHAQMLSTFQPMDHERIKQAKTQKINQLVREFDRGTMEGCKDLKDFFDRLGYLSVRVCEENIAKQRAADLSNSLTVNRYDYNQQLYQAANYNPFPNDPYYQNRPHYMDFVNSAEYADRKKEFFDYCSTSTGTIPLRPIYK